MNVEALEARARQLEQELDSLRAYAEEKEQEVIQAAELGKALLRDNENLEERLGEANRENMHRLEELEQERFSLQQRLECQKATTLAVQQEMEAVKADLQKEYNMREQHLKQAHSKKAHEMDLLCHDLRAETERLEAQGKGYREKIANLEQRLREASELADRADTTSSLQPELNDLQLLYTQEREQREQLQQLLADSQSEVELLSMEATELQGKVDRLTEECEERSDQANEWYKALQASKEHVMELNAQLEAMKMEMAGSNYGTSGNSLFGEVDDRRLQVERKYVSLQVKHDSLEKRHATVSQQYKRLKAEMSSLLCQFSTTGADASHIRRLEVALRQSQTEKESILSKLHKLEKQQASVLSSQERLNYVASFGDKKEYIALIEQQLSRCRKENTTLTKDLEMKALQLVWESQKLREAEDRLHRKEQEQAKCQKEVTMVKLKLQEMQEKLEQADSKCKQQEAQVRLLEDELQSQRRRRSQMNRPTSGRGPTLTADTSAKEEKTAPSNLAEKHDRCHGDGNGSGVVKEPQRTVTKSGPAPISFLEDLEREFEKQQKEGSLPLSPVKAGGPRPRTNTLKAAQKQNCPPPRPVSRTVVVGNKTVNQCPQQ